MICFTLLADKRIYVQNLCVSRLCIVREENKAITYRLYAQTSNETESVISPFVIILKINRSDWITNSARYFGYPGATLLEMFETHGI